MIGRLERYLDELTMVIGNLRRCSAEIELAAATVLAAIKNNRKVILCGNGGSAADSQHLAAELMGRYLRDRSPLPAISLTVDTSALTAIANDYGYGEVFARQLRGIAQRGDVLIGISTSGNSQNVVRAMQVAKEMEVTRVGMTGVAGGQLARECDVCICVPSDKTNHIQEMHIAVGHYICGYVEEGAC